MKKILVIGSTVADIIINLDFLPTTADDVHVKSQTMSLGGCAHNVADMIPPLRRALYAVLAGGDGAVRRLRAQSAGGQRSGFSHADAGHGQRLLLLFCRGKRGADLHRGPRGGVPVLQGMVDQLKLDKLSCAYICGLEIEEKTGGVIVDFLEESGLPVFYGPGPRICLIDPALMERIFALHPVMHLNEDEIWPLHGCDTISAAAGSPLRPHRQHHHHHQRPNGRLITTAITITAIVSATVKAAGKAAVKAAEKTAGKAAGKAAVKAVRA